jgi:hypothetical protein
LYEKLERAYNKEKKRERGLAGKRKPPGFNLFFS